MYPEAVHFRDKNSGKLEEIDNTLMPIQDSACGVYLTNRNNDELKVEFHGAQDVQPKVVDFARPQESKRTAAARCWRSWTGKWCMRTFSRM